MKQVFWLFAATLVAFACTTTNRTEAEPPKELDKFVMTGETEQCLNLRSIRNTPVLDDQHILFELNGGITYLNKLPNRCSGLGFEESFSYSTSLTKLCRQDIIQVIQRGGGGIRNTCGLGPFEKLEDKPEESTG